MTSLPPTHNSKLITQNSIPIAAYVRCSTALQADSAETQLAVLTEYCHREHLTIVAVYADEAVSGGKELESRPAFAQLLADRQAKGFNTVLVLNVDRFSRDIFDFLSFERMAAAHGLAVRYATEDYEDTASGRLQKYIRVLFAQQERERTGERVFQHNRAMCARGQWASGRPPLGFSYDPATKVLGVDPDRSAAAIAVFQTFVDCHGNRTHTAARLNGLGIRTARGNLWRDDAVACVLRNPLYRGRLHYADIDLAVDTVPEVVPAALVAQADMYLVNTAGKRQRGPQQVYTYSSILRCGDCGNTFRLHSSRPSARNPYELYACRGRKERGICSAPKLTTNWLDPLVSEGLRRALATEHELLTHRAEPVEWHAEPVEASSTDNRLANLRRAASRYQEMYAHGIIESVDDLKMKLAEVDARIAELSAQPKVLPINSDMLEALIADLPGYWSGATVLERRGLLLACCPSITVWTAARRIRLHTTLSAGDLDLS